MYIFLYVKKIIYASILICFASFCVFGACVFYNAGIKAEAEEKIPVLVIMYHHVLKDEKRSGKYVVTPTQFEEDLNYLKSKGYTTVLPKDLVNYVYNGEKLPEKCVLLTFDDGYESNYSYIYPIIKKSNDKIVISVVGSLCDEYSKTEESHINYSYLKWNQIKEMHNSGLVDIGNHTYNCHTAKKRKGINKLPDESNEDYENFLKNDIETLNMKIKDITGTFPLTFAYPFGYAQKTSEKILKNMGFKVTLSCEEGINYIEKNNPDCLYMLKRYNRPAGISAERIFPI